MPKPPSTLLASSSGWHIWSTSTITVQAPPSASRRRRNHPSSSDRSPRSFAVPHYRFAHTTSTPPHDDLSWPRHHSAFSIPTPYEIFKLHPSAPYSKRRFYELVKIYHPDSTIHSSFSSPPAPLYNSTSISHHSQDESAIPHALRLHRYRLIVQAHAILSDPDKRAAYDRYGAGWAGSPDIEGLRRADSEYGWKAYSKKEESPSNCATWEDWDSWHRWRYKQEHPGFTDNIRRRQRPMYVSNGSFVVLIVLFTLAGAMHEVSRAGRRSSDYVRQLEETHDRTRKALDRSRSESRDIGDNNERVQRLLRDRRTVPALAAAIMEKEKEGNDGGEDGGRFEPAILSPAELHRNAQMRERRISGP